MLSLQPPTANAKPIPTRVIEAQHCVDTTGRYVAIVFECGDEEYVETLPSGFASTESLVDALLGCRACGERAAA